MTGTIFDDHDLAGRRREEAGPMPGTSLDVLQKVAGHQSPDVTSRYLHPDLSALQAAGESFSAWWSKPGPKPPQLRVIGGGARASKKPR